MNALVIGIAGGTGSGKTTLAKKLGEVFGEKVALMRHDSYYRAQNGLTLKERANQNYDHPSAFETELMTEHLRQLTSGKSVLAPIYDYTVHNRSDKTELIEPRPVIIVEGIMIFADAELRSLMNIKIFVDTDADVRIIRRIVRDVSERKRSLESVITQYLTTVKPMHEQFVEPSKKYADIIIPEGGKNPVALEMLITRIKQELDGKNKS